MYILKMNPDYPHLRKTIMATQAQFPCGDLGPTDRDIDEWLTNDTNRKAFWKYVYLKDKLYTYLVTFTLKPNADAVKAEEFVRAQAQRKGLYLTSFTYVKELTKQGVPHFHAVVQCTKPLAKSRFNYYEKIFGHVDISKTKCQQPDEALNYISKSAMPIKLL